MDDDEADAADRASWPTLAEAMAFAERGILEAQGEAIAKRLLVP